MVQRSEAVTNKKDSEQACTRPLEPLERRTLLQSFRELQKRPPDAQRQPPTADRGQENKKATLQRFCKGPSTPQLNLRYQAAAPFDPTRSFGEAPVQIGLRL